MYCTVQVADAPVPDSVHVSVNVSAPVTETVTMPVGVMAVPGDVSLTVTVHVVDCPTVTMAGLQVMDVLVVRSVTVTFALPLLPVWTESPP